MRPCLRDDAKRKVAVFLILDFINYYTHVLKPNSIAKFRSALMPEKTAFISFEIEGLKPVSRQQARRISCAFLMKADVVTATHCAVSSRDFKTLQRQDCLKINSREFQGQLPSTGARHLCHIIRVIAAALYAHAGLMPAPIGGGRSAP